MSVRKAHNSGRNHLRNVVDYYERTSNQAHILDNR
jgi:U1 small nuclear ribonucleoprotein C